MLDKTDVNDSDTNDFRSLRNGILDAYMQLACAEISPVLQVHPTEPGRSKKALRFNVRGEQAFSVILNDSWLLWYFRKPCWDHLDLEKGAVNRFFPDVHENPRGELQLYIYSVEEVDRLIKWLRNHVR